MSKQRIVKDEGQGANNNSNTTEDFERDLHPNSQPEDMEGLDDENSLGMASNNKEIVQAYPELSKDELKRLMVLPEGTPLENGTIYFDLKHRGRGEFKAGSG